MQIGMPGAEEILSSTMDHQMNVAGFNVRKFIGTAIEGIDLGPYAPVVEEISKAVDEIERETGAPLDGDNDKGWESLKKRVEVSVFICTLHCQASESSLWSLPPCEWCMVQIGAG